MKSKRSLLGLACLIGLGGCVSSTLDSNQFRPVGSQSTANVQQQQVTDASSAPVSISPAAQTTDPADGIDEAGKAAAIAEMRAKGQQTSGQKTHIGALPETAASQLTTAERAKKSAELAKKVTEANSEVTDGEVASKQASIRRLQQKAKNHYQSAVNAIEN